MKIIKIEESPYGTLIEFEDGEELFLLPNERSKFFDEPRY